MKEKTLTSATGRLTETLAPFPVPGHGRRSAAGSGFSLLEVLVVIFIISIVVAIAGLGLGRSAQADAEAEARQLHRVMRLAHEEAVLFRRQLGLEFKSEESAADGLSQYSYQWLSYHRNSESWRPFVDNRSGFSSRKMQPGLIVELEAEEDAVSLEQEEEDLAWGKEEEEEEDEHWPQLLFLSSGEITPFTLIFSVLDEFDSPVTAVRLKGNLYGEMTIEGGDDL